MRKIETLMGEAITQALNWKLANTKVTESDGVSYVYLHGNLIAQVGETWLELYDGGYRSATTKSRLNAILRFCGNGEYIYQKNHQWILSTKDGEEPFRSGTLLD